MKKTLAVALGGGLDSAVAAALLKREGHQVLGIHFKTGYERAPAESGPSTSPASLHLSAQRISAHIDMPLEVVDLSEEFKKEVVDYFIDAYRSGQTPNPCMVCNERIKFGVILDRALALGASHLATGHYARVEERPGGLFSLLKGADRAKDQSYFLARLTQDQLKQIMFPLGDHTKGQVQGMARTWGLESHHGGESQELCFVKNDSYKEFLSQSAGLPGKPGRIVTTAGETIGSHQGLHNYTVGQRRGINVPGPAPYYVVRLDIEHNRLVVGFKNELGAQECLVTGISWIEGEPPGESMSVLTRIRYRHKEAESTLLPVDRNTARICFSEAQDAVTPGQAAVFYQGERVLGGGWILR